jgi:hypothetical protein
LSLIRRQPFKHCNTVMNSGFIRSRHIPSMSLSSLNLRSQPAADAGIVSTSITNLESVGYCCDYSCQYNSGLCNLGSSSAITRMRFYYFYSSRRHSCSCLSIALSCDFQNIHRDSIGPVARGVLGGRLSLLDCDEYICYLTPSMLTRYTVPFWWLLVK